MTHTAPLHRSRALLLVAALLTAVLGLVGCSVPPTTDGMDPTESRILADYGLDGLTAREIIHRLDSMSITDRPAGLLASVQPGELVLTEDAQERTVSVPMPQDEFYLSVAPYLSQTHACHFHSLTTCRGELRNQTVHVTVTNAATGAVLINESMETFDNGFVGLWLPRGIEALLSIKYDDRQGSSTVSTLGEDVPTCLTTIRLAAA